MNNDDYLNSIFNADFSLQESFGEVKINVNFTLDNEGIQELIQQNSCVYSLHIECPQTSYRKVFETTKQNLEISIPSDFLRGKILLHSFILANEKIENYHNNLLNGWFKYSTINFEKGNILAIGDAIETTLFEENLELLNLPSIMKVTKSLKNEFMEVELHSNTITISLPEYEYNQYGLNANSRLRSTILAAVIVPSLVYVFSKIKENREDIEEYTWFQVLEKIFAENHYNIDDVGTDTLSALKAAQLVLRKPLRTSFEEIEKFNSTED